MKGIFIVILSTWFIFLSSIMAFGAERTINFAWDAGPEADLAGYRIFQSQTPGLYNYADPAIDVDATQTSASTTITVEGRYYWVARAYDEAGNESEDSNELTYNFDETSPQAIVLRFAMP